MSHQEANRRNIPPMNASTGAVTTPDVVAQGAQHVHEGGTVMQSVGLRVNGTVRQLAVDTRATLLDTLREQLSLFGSKKGCDHGQCGACTVHVNGRRVNSCLTLAVMHDGDEITTIEGLAPRDALHPMQAAFVEHDAFQCGYCTPGQIMSAAALLSEPCGPEDDDIRECMSGNICRCGAYPNIVAAVKSLRHRT
jgi:xanthine dehydrogenase YagT iron-sulfur-binding subunit